MFGNGLWRAALVALAGFAWVGCGGQIDGDANGPDASQPDSSTPVEQDPVPLAPCRATAALIQTGPVVIAGGADGNGAHRLETPMQPMRVKLQESAQRLYYTDGMHHSVMMVDLATDLVTRVIGTGEEGAGGVGGPATQAQLRGPLGLDVAADGTLVVADTGNQRVVRVDPQGTLTVIASNLQVLDVAFGIDGTVFATTSSEVSILDGGGRTPVLSGLTAAYAMDVGSDGALYVALLGSQTVIKRTPEGTVAVVAGDGTYAHGGDGGLAVNASMRSPIDVHVTPSNELYVVEGGSGVVRFVNAAGIIDTVVGTPNLFGFEGDGGPATSALLGGSVDVERDSAGRLYLADSDNKRIRRVDVDGTIDTFAGLGAGQFHGDGIVATDALLHAPSGIDQDQFTGDIYFADSLNSLIRRIDSAGLIHTVAGTPRSAGYSGDGGPALAAELSPNDVAVDSAGVVYVADTGNNRVRRIHNGVITTFVDNIRALTITTDFQDNLYVSDGAGATIWKVTPTGAVSRFAGDGVSRHAGDGGPAAEASFILPLAIAASPDGSIYISDTGSQRIRRVRDGIIDTVVGTGLLGFNGEGLPALETNIAGVGELAVDREGRLYFAATGYKRIRRVEHDGTVQTVIGNGCQPGNSNCDPAEPTGHPRELSIPEVSALYVSPDGRLLYGDIHRIYALQVADPGPPPPGRCPL